MNKAQASLIVIWLASFVAALGVVVSYSFYRTANGVLLITEDDAIAGVKTIIPIYALYVGAILAALYKKPFKRERGSASARASLPLAIVCTALFNLLVLGYLARGYVMSTAIVTEDFSSARDFAALLSFIVAPVNFFYFGIRAQKPAT